MDSLENIRRQFAYNDWANRRALESLRTLRSADNRAVRAFSHVLLVEKIWLLRINGGGWAQAPQDSFAALPLEELEKLINESRDGFAALLDGLSEADLDEMRSFKTFSYGEQTSRLRDTLTHVLMHSMSHRGQVSLAVREDGGEPAKTDYILFAREILR